MTQWMRIMGKVPTNKKPSSRSTQEPSTSLCFIAIFFPRDSRGNQNFLFSSLWITILCSLKSILYTPRDLEKGC